MAAPTQELPPWLSLTTETLPQTTETTLVYLPLTYFGPSIPLGTLWTYGGLTSPVSTSSAVASTSAPTSAPSTTSMTPSTSASSISTSVIPSSSSSATPSTVSSTPMASSTTPTTSPSASASASASAAPSTSSSSGLSRGQMVGVIIGSILGALVLLLLCLACCMRFCGRRRRRDESSRTPFTSLLPRRRRRTRTRFTMVTPGAAGVGSTDEFDADWLVVHSPDSPQSPQATEPGHGRTEVDPFLQHAYRSDPPPVVPGSGSGSNSGSGNNNSGVGGNSGSASSRETGATASSGTNASGYGVLLAHPSLSFGQHHRAEHDDANPFDVPRGGTPQPQMYSNLPPGAAPPDSDFASTNVPIPGRRILSPSQLAMLVEEEDVLPRPSFEGSRSHMTGDGDREEGEVVIARRVAVLPIPTPMPIAGPSDKERHRSWIPRFSWLRDSRSSRDMERADEEEGGLLLFDAGHSPSNSISSPVSPTPGSPALASPAALSKPRSRSSRPSNEMREFGARPLLPFLTSRLSPPSSRPVSGAERPISGVSGMSSDGTTGSGKSGQTVYEDARETLSTQNSRRNSRVGNGHSTPANDDATAPQQDPLDAPAPAAFAPFAMSSQASLHHTTSRPSLRRSDSEHSLARSLHASTSASASLSAHTHATTVGGTSITTPTSGNTPPKSDRGYPHVPPGLGYGWSNEMVPPVPALPTAAVPSTKTGTVTSGGGASIGSWDAAGLELGFARPASHSKLGTFGSGNRAMPLPVSTPIPAPVATFGSSGAPGIRIVGGSAGASVGMPARDGGASSAPHLSLDLDDAPPGAEGGWRLLGGAPHAQSLLIGNGSGPGWGVGIGDAAGAGKRGTFGGAGAAQYHHASGPSSEHGSLHGSLHSRMNQSINSASLSSRSAHGHPKGSSGSGSGGTHSQYPSSNSGTGSGSAGARARALLHQGSVEGPMSPAVSAFGHLGEHSASSGSGNGHGREQSQGPSPLPRARSPASPMPWAGGLDADWRPTYT